MKVFLVLALTNLALQSNAHAESLAEQRAALFKSLEQVHSLTAEELAKIKAIFAGASVMGQGNPAVTKHPMTREQCLEKTKAAHAVYTDPSDEKICGDKFMAPLFNTANQQKAQAEVCIDRFEFPNIPCEYPVVWVRAKEAVEICEAMGKRLCDAHEWEGACAGSLEPAEYDFSIAKTTSEANAFRKMRDLHNTKHAKSKSWAYGPEFKKGICAQNSTKNDGCNGGDWKRCGSNTYPVGAFPECSSKLNVYDLHGNAAEHMNLPVREDQVASHASKQYGHTEMKGSWFIWDKFNAHQDWCRWRAPYWHGSKVMDKDSHHNYHLGFRCCKDLKAQK